MYLFEILKPSQYRNLVKGWDKSRYAELFKVFKHDKNAYRIYLPLKGATKKPQISPVMKEINAAISPSGYQIKDYSKGIASDGKRDIRLGKLLTDNPQLIQKFANDPLRAASTQQDMMVVISRHPYDLGGMSTDRGWTSCMNLVDGMYNDYVPLDVKAGTIIAYLVKAGDTNINSPVARMLIKPFINEKNPKEIVFGIEDKVYGTAPNTFIATVKAWVNKVNKSSALQGVFVMHPEVYRDSGADSEGTPYEDEPEPIILFNDKEVEKQFKAIQKNPAAIQKIENPSEALQLAAVKKDGTSIRFIDNPSETVQLAALQRHAPVLQYIKNPTKKVQIAAVKLNGSDLEFIKNPSEAIKLAAVKQSGWAIEHIEHPSEAVKLAAVTQLGYVIRKIEDPSKELQLAAVNSSTDAIAYIKNPSEEVQLVAVTKRGKAIGGIKNPSEEVQLAAVTQDGEALEYVKDPSEAVQLAAVNKASHSLRFIKDPSEAVQLAAVKRNGYVIRYLENPSEEVQLAAVNRTGDAIKDIKNPSEEVRRLAEKRIAELQAQRDAEYAKQVASNESLTFKQFLINEKRV